jgi:predicted enzyme related to lactoylglutathione lyase
MKVKEIGLCWIVVKDIQAAVKYYTEVVGLQLAEFNEEYGWAEFEGIEGGTRLGIAQESPKGTNECCPLQAGQNAVMTFTVENLDEVKASMIKKGAKFEGDGNTFQICEPIDHSCCHC